MKSEQKLVNSKLLIWLSIVSILCCLTGCLFMLGGTSGTELPGAVIKVKVPSNYNLETTFITIENVLLEQGYAKQPYDDWLTQQAYIKSNFEVAYDPFDEPQQELMVVYLHFYEGEASQFSSEGIQEYAKLEEALDIVGLKSVAEDQADRDHARWAATPQMFNDRHNSLPMFIPRIAGVLIGIAALLLYGAIILYPAFSITPKIINYFRIPITIKRAIFVLMCSLLAPGLILLTPFGPPFLAPLPIAFLFALLAPPLLILLAISFVVVVIIAFIVSMRIWRSDEKQAITQQSLLPSTTGESDYEQNSKSKKDAN
ncbi:MAG: hypothetical protein KF758_18865 [Anaerolineales bacterium]|nr:hypothetical protein [Anaerolineales bacterium]MBX3038981.1 hypothetical protein [Anaerolineales bacterium]